MQQVSENKLLSHFGSKFKLCRQISPYKTAEQVCRFFGVNENVFSELKPGSQRVRQDFFHDEIKEHDNIGAQWITERDFSDETLCTNTYSFADRYGETVMRVAKLIDSNEKEKTFIPFTSWMFGNSTRREILNIPYSGKQPLYQLDLLLKPEVENVILTVSLEFAALNKNIDDAVISSFFCMPGEFDTVDWKPLRGKNVYYLVMNHSALKLEGAYCRANALYEFLAENEPDISLHFIQCPIHYSEATERVAEEYVKELTRDDFFENYEKSLEELNRRSLEWWKTEEEKQEAQVQQSQSSLPEYVLHPILRRGEATMIYAPKGIGKSYFALSIAGCVASTKAKGPRALIPEKWWVANHSPNKVLYLDFENDSATISERLNGISRAYGLGDEPGQYLIIQDMQKESSMDFLAPENQQKLLTMIEAANRQGDPEKNVNLLVIDTFTKFVVQEDSTSAARFSDFLKKMNERNIATLILTHTDAKSSVKGFKAKLEDMYASILLDRESDTQAHSLEEPLRVTIKHYRGTLSEQLLQPFWISMKDGVFKFDHQESDNDGARTEAQDFGAFVHLYKPKGCTTTARYLDLGETAFFERRKKYKEQ